MRATRLGGSFSSARAFGVTTVNRRPARPRSRARLLLPVNVVFNMAVPLFSTHPHLFDKVGQWEATPKGAPSRWEPRCGKEVADEVQSCWFEAVTSVLVLLFSVNGTKSGLRDRRFRQAPLRTLHSCRRTCAFGRIHAYERKVVWGPRSRSGGIGSHSGTELASGRSSGRDGYLPRS